jgi:glyoxylase-like metal-dependent hydrolase (beta-lactamase superfamily II)
VEQTRPAPGIRAHSRWIFNCYVIEDGGAGRSVVIDPGIPSNGVAALNELHAIGADPGQAVITATHAHSDHVAGMPHIHREVGAPIYLPAKVRDYLAAETPRSPGLREIMRIAPVFFEQPFDWEALVEAARTARSAGFGGAPFRFDEPIAGFLDDSDALTGAPDWEVLRTPGHTDCSTCFWNPKTGTLLSGDTVLTYGGHAWFNPETTDEHLMDATEERLRSLPVQHLLPGHGRPISGPDLMGAALSHRERAPRGWWLPWCRK